MAVIRVRIQGGRVRGSLSTEAEAQGILVYKALYVILLAAYAASAIWLFLELTSDRVWRPRPTDTPGAGNSSD